MPVTVVVGAQWGDEGKAKVIDLLAADHTYVVRYQGGHNAGHTVVVDDQKYALQLVPSGVLYPHVTPVIGNGVVVDLPTLFREVDTLQGRGIDCSKLRVSSQAHLIFPWHQAIDALHEASRGDERIGTTLKGIGPAYADKARRDGIRAGETADAVAFAAEVRRQGEVHNREITALGGDSLDVDEIVEQFTGLAARVAPLVVDTVELLHGALDRQESILLEGAQATFLDLDHGTYPYVTSSNPTAGGACVGSGIGPRYLDRIVGITKAYCTRVGGGPFPTEALDEWGDKLVEIGHEFGTVTGRRRRTGWLDLVMLRKAVRINSLTEIALTKLDVLDTFPEVLACTEYDADGRPVYVRLPGWQSDISAARTVDDLAPNAQALVDLVQREVGVPVTIVGTGPARERGGQLVVIPRYTLPEMAAVFSDEARFARYLEIELLATDAHAVVGVVPAADAARCRERAPKVDAAFVEAVAERERITDHDVAAFVDVVQAAIGQPAGGWIHYGLTSSDVVDTAWCAMMRDACDLMINAASTLRTTLVRLARQHRDTVMIGRTHGIHAEPTTFGAKVALWALQVGRDLDRLHRARDVVAVCKLSGAVGTYSNIDPVVEAHVGAALGLQPVPATQVIARDRHAEFLWACAAVGSTMELIAVELRHLQRTEVSEVQEGFKAGQKGSSAMPHKRNPISAETISGLSRVLRGNLQAGLQDVALWHERDISHSSVERIVVPDSALLAYYVLRRMARLLDGLVVFPERMRANLDASFGLVFSQPVLLALVQAGVSRDEAYRIVQESAAEAWSRRRPLREVLEERHVAGAEVLDQAFSLTRSLRHAGDAVDALIG